MGEVAKDLLGASGMQVAEMLPGKGRDLLLGQPALAGMASPVPRRTSLGAGPGTACLGLGVMAGAREGSGTPAWCTRPLCVPAEARRGEVRWWTSKP